MMKSIEKLLEVQDKDIRIFNLRKQIESVPEEKNKVSKILKSAEDNFSRVKGNMVEVEKKIKTIEIDISSHKERIQNLQSKSAEIKKNDEYKAFLKEVEDFNKKVSTLEDSQLELWEELEKTKGELEKEKKACDAAKARIESAIKDFDIRSSNCNKQIEIVKEERTQFLKDIPAHLLKTYQRITMNSGKKGVFRKGVVPLQNDACGGCFLKVTPQIKASVRKGEFTTCENCGTILFYGE